MSNKKVILIIEDEAPMSHVLKLKLEGVGYEVLTEIDGADGLHTAMQEHPDLILLDIIMPVLDGITMLKKLREDTWGKHVQVIMLTNLTDSKMIEESVAEGAFDYIIKSDWSLDKIVEKINKKLS